MPHIHILGLICALLLAALAAPSIHRIVPKATGWLLALAPLSCVAYLISLIPTVNRGESVALHLSWFPQLQTQLDFRVDGLSVFMGLLICGIGALILIYAQGYLKGHKLQGRFFGYLMLFMAAMLGIVTSDNLILLFVFWELTSISSYLLIGFYHESDESRWKSLQALLVTGMGGVAMLAGFILLGIASDTWTISQIASGDLAIPQHALYPAILTLILLGAFTKSAQFPFHFWLPNAMAGPAPVSAFLHSATMVKAGVFLLARFHPILADSQTWVIVLTSIGALTMLIGVINGILQSDLKKILAYTTLSVLGMLVMLLGLSTELALKSALLFLLAHALYKATLFMCAGSIDHETGSRDVRILSGLRKTMPLTAIAGGLAAFSMAGAPPFFGFLGKEYVYKTGSYLEHYSFLILAVAMISNMLMMALGFFAGLHPFWGKENNQALPKAPHEAPLSMYLGPLLLGSIGLVFGLFPDTLATPLIAPALAAMTGHSSEIHLSLWHGVNLPLILSIFTLIGGTALYLSRKRIWQSLANRPPLPYTLDGLYTLCFNSFVATANWQTKFLQSGSLRQYLLIIVTSSATLIASMLYFFSGSPQNIDIGQASILEWTVAIMVLVSLFFVVTAQSRITALVAMGVIGFCVAIVFILYGAPDLAITQILVETLTVVLFMLVIYRLPAFRALSTTKTKMLDAFFSGSIGIGITFLVIKAQSIEIAPSISQQFGEWSYILAKGKNVVNVILVDFRALDTLGEITVLAIAAIGIYTLLRSWIQKKKENS